MTATALIVTEAAPAPNLLGGFRGAGFNVVWVADLTTARQELDARPVDLLVATAGDKAALGEFVEWALNGQRVEFAFNEWPSESQIADIGSMLASDGGTRRNDADERSAWRADHCPELIGESTELLRLIDQIRNTADTDCPVLVTGESGTGKELIAKAIHAGSRRRSGPFVALNCAAIPDTLIEAELFGHARGAFTGAHAARHGRFVLADGGTLFLDEIGDMPLALQAKLLRVLQERVVTPLGDSTTRSVDVRIVAATHQDLEAMVIRGKFRADLFYRLNVIPMHVPGLAKRKADIPLLARHFLERAIERIGRSVLNLAPDAEETLKRHSWHGNIRQLQNVIERIVVLKRRGTITRRDVLENLSGSHAVEAEATTPPREARPAMVLPESTTSRIAEDLDLRRAQDELERQFIQAALVRSNGNRTEAAALLGLNRSTLVEKLKKIA